MVSLGLWVCLIYSFLQGMGVPTERGTGRSVYLFRTTFFFSANVHCHTFIKYSKMIVRPFFAFFSYKAYKPIFKNKDVFIFLSIYLHFYLKVMSVLFWHSLNVFTSKNSIGSVFKCKTRLNLQFNQVERMVLTIVQFLVKWIAIWCLFTFCNLKN